MNRKVGSRGAGEAPLLAGILLLAGLPQRATGPHVLGSPVRANIMRALDQTGGLTLGELRERFALGWGQSYHHIRKLERAGLITSQRFGRRRIILPRRAYNSFDAARAYLRGATAHAIFTDIESNPGTHVKAIAQRTGLTPRAVYYHVSELIDLGALETRSRSWNFALRTNARFVTTTTAQATACTERRLLQQRRL